MKRLGDPPYICLITRGKANLSNFETEKTHVLETIRDAVADGVNLVQIREKTLPARLLFDLVRETVEILAGTSALLFVNGRPDVAIAAGADGVHLPENSYSPEIACRVFGDRLVIGISTHSLDQANIAAASGADYAFFGPVFETPGKGPPAGPAALRAVCSKLRSFPVIALGGVNERNSETVLAAGAAGIAAIRSLHNEESRRAICKVLTSSRSPDTLR